MSEKTDRFLSIKAVAEILGVSKSTIYRMEKSGALPPKAKLSYKTVGWSENRLNQWMISNL